METHILFIVAAVLAAAINSLAGGGGLITFPLLALVVPPWKPTPPALWPCSPPTRLQCGVPVAS
jgi:uncharacterized membrane protein YfcA